MPRAPQDQTNGSRRAATSGATLLLVLLVLTALPNGAASAAAALAEPHRSSDARDVSREFRTLATRLVEAGRVRDGAATRAIAAPSDRQSHGATFQPVVVMAERATPEPAAWGVRPSLLNLPPPRA